MQPTGRAKSAPDDKLRAIREKEPRRLVFPVIARSTSDEAIHCAAQRKNGLLRRFAPRNDDKTHLRDPATPRARGLPSISRPLQPEGAGMPGAQCARKRRVQR